MWLAQSECLLQQHLKNVPRKYIGTWNGQEETGADPGSGKEDLGKEKLKVGSKPGEI